MSKLENLSQSFEKILWLNETLKSTAEKYKISTQSLVLLLSIYCKNDLTNLLNSECETELINLGFLDINTSKKLTGKGAILAKSLEILIEKY